MQIIPAIDLRGGRCVRLYQGDYGRETVYGEDPAAMARHWVDLGATRLHVVDLDGARTGEQVNADAVAAIVDAVSVPLQVGGGVRSLATIERWLGLGVARVFLGTAAVEDEPLVVEACKRFPGAIGVGTDAREGHIAVRGWEQSSGEPVAAFAARMLTHGVAAISYTDIGRDGTLDGPDVDGVRQLLTALPAHNADFIVAGGVGTLAHLEALGAIDGVDAAIVGRALYEGTVDLPAALAAFGR